MSDENPQETQPKKKSEKKLFLLIGALFVGLAIIYGISLGPTSQNDGEQVAMTADEDGDNGTEMAAGLENGLSVAPQDEFVFNLNTAKKERVLGDPSAPIKISEHSSFTCGHCGHFHKTTFDEFKANYIDTGKAYLVFSDFPLNQPALHATMIARCIPDDGQYFDFVDTLFKNQDAWAFEQNYLSYLEDNAARYGLDKEAVKTCLNNQELQDAIVKRMQAVQQQFAVNSTPSFVVNNQVVINGALPYPDFDKAIQAAIESINSVEEQAPASVEPSEGTEEPE